MSTKVSFDSIDKEQLQQDLEIAETRGAAAAGTELSTHAPGGEAEFSPEDLNIDHIQIYGKSSQFEPDTSDFGSICLNKEVAIAAVDEPVKALLVTAKKYWKENVPFDDDTVPQFANTVEEKARLDANSAFGKTIPVCDIFLLLQRPEAFDNDEEAARLFIYEFGGKEFALVKYTVQKAQAVRENFGTINAIKLRCASKKLDPSAYYFELRSKEKGEGSRFKWHQFVLSGTLEEAPAEATAFVSEIAGL